MQLYKIQTTPHRSETLDVVGIKDEDIKGSFQSLCGCIFLYAFIYSFIGNETAVFPQGYKIKIC